jgi:pyruvate kinase
MITGRRTKIVATLGPASQTAEILDRMLAAGVDVVRLNFSHGTPQEHLRRLETARHAADARGVSLAVLQDLPGPKLRVGPLPGGSLVLEEGKEAVLTSWDAAGGSEVAPPGAGTLVPVAYRHLTDDLRAGDRIYLQDGELALAVRRVAPPYVWCTVESGGRLRQGAGMNIPGVGLSVSAVTDEDLRCLEWGIAHDVDYVGLSFVESAGDVERLRRAAADRGGACRVVAKIERRGAVDRIEEIAAAADAVMVARGDLAVETSIEEVPLVQKHIVGLCNRLGKPVITATQMLESMVERPRPTRAEATDVANAVFDGTDALMLSGETAIGAHPVAAVATMSAIATRAEAALPYELLLSQASRARTEDPGEAIALAACEAAEAIGAAAIVAATDSGSTARRVSRLRPRRHIVAVTHTRSTWRALSLVWGVRPVLVEPQDEIDGLVSRGVRAAVELGVARPGDRVVVTAGVPIGRPGTTNMLRVIRVQ